MTTKEHLIVFRPESPLSKLYEPYKWAMFVSKAYPCLAVRCSNLQEGLLGFVQFSPVHAEQPHQESRPAQIPLSEILLIADELSPAQQQIGFLRGE